MIMGVILQTVAIGSLISIAALLDDSGEYKDKVETLIYSNKEYDMSVQFYIQLHKFIRYEEKKQGLGLNYFMEKLPY